MGNRVGRDLAPATHPIPPHTVRLTAAALNKAETYRDTNKRSVRQIVSGGAFYNLCFEFSEFCPNLFDLFFRGFDSNLIINSRSQTIHIPFKLFGKDSNATPKLVEFCAEIRSPLFSVG